MKEKVLILCTGNSARSQMAEGLLRAYAGDRFDAASAGVMPTSVRAEAIAVMDEIGIDISQHRSKSVDEFADRSVDIVITVCDNANENCPVFPGKVNRFHWSFDDPAAVTGTEVERLAAFRSTRDKIAARIKRFLSDGD